MTSADAISAPALVEIEPDGRLGATCSANAASTSGSSRRPASIMCRAPWKPSSPGWNMKRTEPPSRSRRSPRRRAAPTSIATCASCPHACIAPSTSLEYGRSVSSGIGSASMSARRRITGPSAAPRRSATTDDTSPPETCTSRSTSCSASTTAACVTGSSRPSSGWWWIFRRRATASGRTRLASRSNSSATNAPSLIAAPTFGPPSRVRLRGIPRAEGSPAWLVTRRTLRHCMRNQPRIASPNASRYAR